MNALVETIWKVWRIGTSIYDYIHTSYIEERIHTLESTVMLHKRIIGLLMATLAVLVTYIFLRRH